MPGALGTAETDWSYQLDGLAAAHRVISFDPRGYGKSRPPTRDFPTDFYLRDAQDGLAVMDALGERGKPFDLLGWSDGANAAVHLTAAYPERVRRLVIFGGNSWVSQEDVAAYEATRDVKATWSNRMRAALEDVYGEQGLQDMWSKAVDAWTAIHAAGGNICGDEAKTIKCPTLVLGGEKDPIVPAFHPRWFEENIPGAKLHMFPEGKHNIHQKYSEDFNEVVSAFLLEAAR